MNVPIACTLTAEDLGSQRDRWRRLGARALVERVETEDGLRISFRCEAAVEEELRALAAVETRCCPWAQWEVKTAPDQVVLDVRSTGEGVATLHGMFTSIA